MRDKVKRFLSILMTALMLVNLLPVGALAEGMKLDSNSVQSIWWWPWPEETWPDGSYKIYVYAKVLKGSVGGINVNKDGWYTLGYIDAQTMPSPIGTLGNLYGGGNAQGYDLGSLNAQSLIQSSAFHFEKNTNIPVRNTPIWSTDGAHGFKACSGATDYPETGNAPAWHLNILVNLEYVTPIHRLVFKVENSSGTQIGSKAIEGTWGQEITYEKGKDVPETITTKDGKIYELKRKNDNLGKTFKFDEVTKQIEFYYKYKGSVNHTLTINYVYEDGSEAAKSYQKTLPYQSYYSVTSPDITGYTADNPVVSGTMPADNVEVTVTYTKRTDLSYTVNYYWNGTEDSVMPSKTVRNREFGEEVTESPIGADGYTPVSNDPKKITIGTGNNEITFYYYKNVTLTANSKTETYDGTQKSVSGFTGAPTEADFSAIEVGAKGTNAGTYDAIFPTGTKGTVDATKKYIVTEATDGWLKIDPVETEVVVKITGNTKTETYNGKEHNVEGYTVTSISNPLYTANDFTFTGTAEAKGTNAGTYPMGLTADQFTNNKSKNFSKVTFEVADGWLKINPVETEVVVKIAGNTKTETYNGKEHNVEGYTVTSISNPLYTANDFTFSGTAEAKGTDAGTYPMGLTADQFTNNKSKNFSKVTFEVADGWLKINPIDKVTVTITGRTLETTYDGKEHDVFGYDATPSNALYRPNEDIQFNGTDYNKIAKGTDAGTYPMGLEVSYFTNISDNFTNVEFIVTDGYVKINPRPVMLTSANLIKVYDGTPLTNGDAPVKEEFGTEKAFPEGEGVTYAFTGGQTNAGSSKNMFTYAWNEGTNKDNYTIYQIEGDLVVTPIDGIKVTITGRKDTQTYDGKPHKVEGYDVKPDNPLFTEKDIKFNGEAEATGTDVRIDPYQMGLKPEQFTNTSNNFTNVEFVVEDGQIVITPRPVTLTSETAGKTYDGTALEKPVVTVGGDGFVEGQVKEIKATGSVTNAGSVANTITFTPNKETFKEGNYAITKTEGTLTIAKRSVLITSPSATKTYDGSALTRPAVTITGDGFVPGELAKAEATGSITNVGSTPNAIRYTTTGAFNAANYSIALSVGTLTVTEKPKPEPRRTFNLTINYVYQNGKRAAASYNRGGLKNGETFDITSPVIAGYTASETVVSGTIYNRDIKVTVIYTADGVNLDDYGVPLGLGNITMNVGDCFE